MGTKAQLFYPDVKDRPAGASVSEYYKTVRSAWERSLDKAEAIIEVAEREDRGLLASEQREYNIQMRDAEQCDLLWRRIEAGDEWRGQQIDRSQILGAGTDPDDSQHGSGGRWVQTGGGHTYRPDDVRSHWVKDLISASMHGDHQARERLQRNNREVANAPEHRALSSADGAGGEWVPPLWLMNESLQLARAGRVVADQISRQPLPEGTDSLKLPRMATGTAVAEQVTQNTDINITDATTDSVSADVATIAGGQVVSLQLIEQSPVPLDRMILPDLLADLATKTDRFTLANNAAGKQGILAIAGTNQVSYTDSTPTMAELYPKVADAIQQIHTGRFLPPTKIFMHPRRWAWASAQSDSTGRPLVVPAAQMPSNAAAAMGAVVAEGFVGSMQGLPVFVDPNIPTNLGTGTNEDRIIVARAEDIVLWESVPRAEAMREPLARQLSVLLRVYNYAAVQAGRYPKAISVIGGTGLATPTF